MSSNAARVIDLETFRRRKEEQRPPQNSAPVAQTPATPMVWCWVWVPFFPIA